MFLNWTRDFPRPDLGQNIPPQFKNEQKLPKMVYTIPNFLVLHFGENFHENPNKNSKVTDLCMKICIKCE